ncbi:MAG: hypothetical protein ACREJ2_05630 [Planctomycetota bacterium]
MARSDHDIEPASPTWDEHKLPPAAHVPILATSWSQMDRFQLVLSLLPWFGLFLLALIAGVGDVQDAQAGPAILIFVAGLAILGILMTVVSAIGSLRTFHRNRASFRVNLVCTAIAGAACLGYGGFVMYAVNQML